MKDIFKKKEPAMTEKGLMGKEADVNVSSDSDSLDGRAKWGRQIEFTLSCIGYAVGLGNLWRFPYLCMRNGGGAFLIPYYIFLFLCGLPLFYMELILGQFSGTSPLSVWKLCPIFKGIGWGMIIVSGVICVYYNIIITWVLYYLGVSMSSEIPWKTCNNDWNTENCTTRVLLTNESVLNFTRYSDSALELSSSNITDHGKTSAAEEFWHYKILNISDGIEDLGGIKWELLLCLTAAWILVYLCLFKGIRSSGKVVYVTATVPYLFLTILLIRGVTLPGSLNGIKFYIIPKWEKLLVFEVWAEACRQIFYSLGPAWGGLITMASYNKFNNNCLKDALVVCVANSGTSFLSGFVIFSVLGFMAHEAGLAVDEVVTQGPGLAFVTYPEAIARLPISPFWAICFFLMLLFLGLDSQFATLETVTSGFIDEFPQLFRKHQSLFIFLVCGSMYLIGLPLVTAGGMYVFQILDWYAAAFSVMVIALCECIVICYIYGIGRFYHDMSIMLKHQPSYIWAVLWCGVTPVLLLTMLIVSAIGMKPPTYGDYIYPWWAEVIGWTVASLSVIPLPAVAVYRYILAKGTPYQKFTSLLSPMFDWGPAVEPYRTDYKYSKRSYSWRQRMCISRYNPEHMSSNGVFEDLSEKVALNKLDKPDVGCNS